MLYIDNKNIEVLEQKIFVGTIQKMELKAIISILS